MCARTLALARLVAHENASEPHARTGGGIDWSRARQRPTDGRPDGQTDNQAANNSKSCNISDFVRLLCAI